MPLSKRVIYGVVSIASFISLAGCSAQDGFQEGLADGISAALASLIVAPVDAWIAATFPG